MPRIHNPFSADQFPDLTAAIRGVVDESHTREQLEKLSITKLRELLKRYSGKPGSGRELADIRGLLRARGAGSVLDEGRKGLGKTKYGKALEKMGAAVAAYNKSPKPTPPVNPFKKAPVKEGMTPCERSALQKVKAANAADLKEYPGKRGERAHKRLHKTVGDLVGEAVAKKPVAPKKPDPHAGARGVINKRKAIKRMLSQHDMRW